MARLSEVKRMFVVVVLATVSYSWPPYLTPGRFQT